MQTLERTIMANAATDEARSIELAAVVDVQAAAGKDRPATFELLLYNGGLLKLTGWDRRVIIDLKGMEHGARVPLLADHHNSLGSQLGDGEITKTASNVTMRGHLARGTALVEHLMQLTSAGVAVQASIGASVERLELIKEGETVKVNGQNFTGPVYVARKTTVREASVVPAGADADTSVRVAANADNPTPATPTAPSADALAERERIRAGLASIQLHASDLGSQAEVIRAQFIEGSIDSRELDARILSAIRASRPSTPAAVLGGGQGGNVANSATDLEAATLILLGHADLAEKMLGAECAQRGEDLGIQCCVDLAAAATRLEGKPVPHSRDPMIRASFSTMSLPLVLSNAAGKIAYAAYMDVMSTWRSFAKRESLANFKEHDAIRTHLNGRFEDIGADGEIKHVTLGEQGSKLTLGTSGMKLAITRKHIINDDLGMFDGNAQAMGAAAARRISDDVWTLIMANPDSFWSVGNSNYISGVDSALTVDGLGSAVNLLRKQVDPDGKPIALTPTTLVVPPELELTARALLDSIDFQHAAADSGPTGNPARGIAKLEVEPRLSSTAFTGNSTKAWHLFARPSDAPVVVGFLNGREQPIVETTNADFNTLGIQMRAYIDHGVALGDYRASVKSKGEA